MKRFIHSYEDTHEDVFSMAKISHNFMISDLRRYFGVCNGVYFSKKNSSHSPRIKFDGGTKKTSITKNMPAITVERDGFGHLELQPFHTEETCPNAYNRDLVRSLGAFAHKYRSVLLLTWFFRFDEAAVERYFSGEINFNKLLKYVENTPKHVVAEMQKCRSLDDLHILCKKYNLYSMPSWYDGE